VSWKVWLGMAFGIGVGVFATWYPMRAGMKNLKAMEF
jgi:hypothetical protein